MATKRAGGTEVDVNEEGFMTDPRQWSREIAVELAREEGIVLGDRHWKVLEFVRRDGEENGEAPNVRRMTKIGGIPTKELYDLFPGGPAKKAARIAGYPNPHGCI